MPRMPPLVAVLMICKRAAKQHGNCVSLMPSGMTGNEDVRSRVSRGSLFRGCHSRSAVGGGSCLYGRRQPGVPEPTTTKRKKPSMIGPTPSALLLCTNHRGLGAIQQPHSNLAKRGRGNIEAFWQRLAHLLQLHLASLEDIAMVLIALRVGDALGRHLYARCGACNIAASCCAKLPSRDQTRG